MQEEKKSIVDRLYFVRATLSKISLLNDTVISAKRKADGEIAQQENLVQRQKTLNEENREKIEEDLAAVRKKRWEEERKYDPSSSKGDFIWMTIWATVFALPQPAAAITAPLSAATSLIPLTANSLRMMIITAQAGISPKDVRQISADETRSLSAMGSINLPKDVIILYFLAIAPSR